MSEPVESKSRSSREATLSDLQELRDLIHAYVSESQNTRLEGHQAFSTDPTPQQLKALAQHHRQTLEVEERRHQIEQTTKDNEAKRAQETKAEASRLRRENFTYYSIVIVILGSLVTSGVVRVNSNNADTRDFGQDAFLLTLGGLVGALAGYFTGKSRK